MKKLKNLLSYSLLLALTLCVSGCATLSYVGDDYSEENTTSIKTNEDFIFNIYKKTTDNANIKMGISKTPVPEVLALYVQVENLSYETPYSFRVEDLRLFNARSEQQFITSTNYLNIYQNQEASSMSALSNVGATLSNMTGMYTNYNEYNQSMIQNASEQSSKSAFSRIGEVGNQIMKHSIKHSAVVSPRRSQYFYFFFEDADEFPITVTYKNLSYKFML